MGNFNDNHDNARFLSSKVIFPYTSNEEFQTAAEDFKL